MRQGPFPDLQFNILYNVPKHFITCLIEIAVVYLINDLIQAMLSSSSQEHKFRGLIVHQLQNLFQSSLRDLLGKYIPLL